MSRLLSPATQYMASRCAHVLRRGRATGKVHILMGSESESHCRRFCHVTAVGHTQLTERLLPGARWWLLPINSTNWRAEACLNYKSRPCQLKENSRKGVIGGFI